MEQILAWLNGKKTTIGCIVLLIATFLEQVVVAQWGVQSELITKIIGTCDWFGMILSGVGLTHKGVKVINGTEPQS